MKKSQICVRAALTALAGGGAMTFAKTGKADIQRGLTTFNEIYKELNTSYVDTLDAKKNIRMAIDAIAAFLTSRLLAERLEGAAPRQAAETAAVE